jgi:hypothetical protein
MCGPKFCSMKITEDVREFARSQGLETVDSIDPGDHTHRYLIRVLPPLMQVMSAVSVRR